MLTIKVINQKILQRVNNRKGEAFDQQNKQIVCTESVWLASSFKSA